jgi:hypothetical protein
VFTVRYGLIPYIKQIAFHLLKVNDLVGVFRYSDCHLFVDGIERFDGMKSHQGSLLHQLDITGVCGWCISNIMNTSINTARVISFTRKTSLLCFDCKLYETSILQSLTASKICSWYSDSPRAGQSRD